MDQKTLSLFNPASVVVTRDPALQGYYTDDDLIKLSGAPANSQLIVSIVNDAIQLEVKNPQIQEMIRLIYQEPIGEKFYIVNAAFVLQNNILGQGIGPRSVSIEIEQARKMGFTRIQTWAIGDFASFNQIPAYRGYYVWPLMGFDAVLPVGFLGHPNFPQGLGAVQTLQQLLDTQLGRNFWLANGSSIPVSFELGVGSGSWKSHFEYLSLRHIRV